MVVVTGRVPRSPGMTTVATVPFPSARCLSRMWRRISNGGPLIPKEWLSDDARNLGWKWGVFLFVLMLVWLWAMPDEMAKAEKD